MFGPCQLPSLSEHRQRRASAHADHRWPRFTAHYYDRVGTSANIVVHPVAAGDLMTGPTVFTMGLMRPPRNPPRIAPDFSAVTRGGSRSPTSSSDRFPVLSVMISPRRSHWITRENRREPDSRGARGRNAGGRYLRNTEMGEDGGALVQRHILGSDVATHDSLR